MRSCSKKCSKTRILGYSERGGQASPTGTTMGSSSNHRLAALTLWIVAASVAIALLGSSTLLFPGPDVGGQTTAPPGRDVVARVVARIFGPTQGPRATPPPPPALEPSTVVPPSTGVASVPTTGVVATERNPRATDGTTSRPRLDAPTTARKDKGGKTQRAKSVEGAKSRGNGKAVAGAKSKGHGPLKFEPPRGPKQSHVRPAKAKGKSAGRPPGHARARR
jgi:hypothetical protein